MSYADEEQPYDGESAGTYWREQLEDAEGHFKNWEKQGKGVVARYRDERESISQSFRGVKKFNILWSNVQVLYPALYGRQAKPEVSRRYMDSDPIARLASTILERVLEYEVEQFPDYNSAVGSSVQDRLLAGRGTAWIRYCPIFVPEEQTEDEESAQITNTEENPVERIDSAHSPIDYVYWCDFIHSPARTWDEVWWVARWVYMTKTEGIQRFGAIFRNVPIDSTNADADMKQSAKVKASVYNKKAKVAEVWNKRTGKVCWVAKGYDEALDERDDPLGLEEFFPCPRPLFATVTNGSMIPVPDFCEYQDQAAELDSLTNRINNLVRAVKAAGVFNAEYKEVGRLLNEGVDNTLIPVNDWAAMSEKGGLKGAVELLDLKTVLLALQQLYISREAAKQVIYEICGISDILRGATEASETLGAQQMKANFGSLRMKSSQDEVARFASDLFRLKAQVICKFYPPDLLVEMSGILKTPEGVDPQLVDGALQMLKDGTTREFSITVESDTLAQIDDKAEKEAATEAITVISKFIAEAMPMVAQAPETLPMVSEMLLYLVRRYRAGRGLESSIEKTMKALQEKAAQAQGQPPANPEDAAAQAKIQAQQQTDQARLQFEAQAVQMKLQAETQLRQAEMQLNGQIEQMKAANELKLKAFEQNFEKYKVDLESATKIKVAEIAAHASEQRAAKAVTQ